MKYALLFGFWGEWFTDSFLKYSMQSLLAPENLPLASKQYNISIKIATTATCQKRLNNNAGFQYLADNYDVEILAFPDEHTTRSHLDDEKYSVWASMLNPLIEKSAQEERNFFFMHPDSLYPNGFLIKVIEQALSGKKLMFTAGVRVDSEKVETMLPQYSTDSALNISGQAFEAFTIDCLHDFVKKQYWNSDKLSHWPSALFHKLDDNITVARFFDMHPIYVDHRIGNVPIKKNLDVDYDFDILAKLFQDECEDSVHVLSNENSYFMSLTTPDDTWANRLILVGDDASASLEEAKFPTTDSEKFNHVVQWAQKYVPLKKVLCFQPLYTFRTAPNATKPCPQSVFEFSSLCDHLLQYVLLTQEQPYPFSLELPQLNTNIHV